MGSQAFIVYKLVTKLFGATPVEVPMQDFGHDLEAMRAAVTDQTRWYLLPARTIPPGLPIPKRSCWNWRIPCLSM